MSEIEFRECPHCGEEINRAALKCRYCTRWVVEETVYASGVEQVTDSGGGDVEAEPGGGFEAAADDYSELPAWPSIALNIIAGLLIALGLGGMVIGAGTTDGIGILAIMSSAASLLSGIGFLVMVKLLS